MRELLTEILSQDPAIEVVGSAADPYIARQKIMDLRPDVLTLDVEMPRMDGLTFLEKLMEGHPMRVLMVSSLTDKDCDTTLRALELGAIDYVTKPKLDVRSGTLEHAAEIVAKVKMASCAKIRRLYLSRRGENQDGITSPGPKVGPIVFQTTHKTIAVGASTGGTEALVQFLRPLPADSPGIVIVQHMPQGFTRSFASRLDSICRVRVKEAQDGDRILPGHVLLAPGNAHVEVVRTGVEARTRVFQGEPVNHHRPSVDVLFHSCAQVLGRNALGVILTGMGTDGARGLLAMRQAGAHTFAQDEASCVVFGMPREAIELGAAEEIVPLDNMAQIVSRIAARG
jgi:two-component system chemotaxis response regulator CheB